MFLFPLALLFSSFTLAISQSSQWNRPEPTVSIDSGPLIGTTTHLPQATASVIKFLGVPYASSPPKRFSPPTKPQAWTSPLRANRWKASCIQQFNEGPGRNFTLEVYNSPAPKESEDCLYLNVYAPATEASGRGRAVMVWLYGGSLQFGHAGQVGYDGSGFASYQDVIVVTLNYRTNVFGFPGSPELPLNQRNLGFLDQRLALDWVQRNIDVFGGDPDKVTIFGESAGGFSVDALITSYGRHERPPFRAAILQSGQISYRGTPINPQTSINNWAKLTSELGCAGNRTITCMKNTRNLPSERIKAIVERFGLVFQPVADNKTLMAAPAMRRLQGQITPVPILIGSNSQEGRVFVQGQSDVMKYALQTFSNDSKIANEVVKAYPIGGQEFKTGFDAVAQVMTEFSFQCNTALYVKATQSVGIPVWRYYFNATFPNLQTFPDAGVFHASEIKLIFGTYGKGTGEAARRPTPPDQHALSEFMQGSWARFAKDPWSGPGWTATGRSPTANDIGNLGTSGPGVSMMRAQEIDRRCNIYNDLYKKANGV